MVVAAHTSDYRSGFGEMVEDQQVEGGSYVGGAYRNGEGRGAACGGGAHRVMKERFLKLIDFVWRHGEVWSYGGAVVVDQKAEGKYEVTVEELMAEL
ncbi:hypothetical protein Bca52824_083355 [Brassica carinata]|uniref:Uncharacterized protein n=1 Tax=Brassica carinata TaxID=52824 RepID=A0A8X7PIZ2_BRACI|nr:hypothetical protein Bca52824_083355 [Brassica carinata]